MCKCVNIKFGTYERKTGMVAPWVDERGFPKLVYIDTCLVQEIAELWAKGIRTIECCCGHNSAMGYIAVEERDVDKMVALGYTVAPQAECHDEHFENIFLPKFG